MGRRDPRPAPSSSRREHGPDHHHRTVGCMAGIFHFFSRHHHHSHKRLTSAKKKEKAVILTSPSKTSPEKTQQPCRRSCDDPRSPTIPVKIRRRSTESTHSPRQPPTLLPRLMGLEEASPAGTPRSESAAEKRRKLLGALEKCDEDLKTLKRIIDAVRNGEVKTTTVVFPAVESPPAAEGRTGSAKIKARAAGFEMDGGDLKAAELGNGEQPSPVSVLDAISSPRYRSKRTDSENEIVGVGSKIVKPSRMGVVFLGDHHDQNAIKDITNSTATVDWNSAVSRQKTTAVVEEMPVAPPIFCRISSEESCRKDMMMMRSFANRAMVLESLGEVWEERSEVGRVAGAAARGILWELVEEMVVEMQEIWWCSRSRVSLPMRQYCRKRLFN